MDKKRAWAISRMPLLRPSPTEIRIQLRAVPTRINSQRSAFLSDDLWTDFIGLVFDKYRPDIIEVQPAATLSFYIKTLTTIKINRCLTHAYVFSRKFSESLVKISWREIPFDDLLCTLNDEFYAIYPSFAFQSNSRSDNRRFLPLDKFRRLSGGLRRLQKGNELYHRHRTLVILLHIIIILLIILLVF